MSYIRNAQDAQTQLEHIKNVEKEHIFLKKQILAHAISTILITHNIEEAQIIYCVEKEEDNDYFDKVIYFDVSTSQHPFTHYDSRYEWFSTEDEIAEKEYFNRSGLTFTKLPDTNISLAVKSLNRQGQKFLQNNTELRLVLNKLEQKPFGPQIEDILRVFYSPSDFLRWQTLKEQDFLKENTQKSSSVFSISKSSAKI